MTTGHREGPQDLLDRRASSLGPVEHPAQVRVQHSQRLFPRAVEDHRDVGQRHIGLPQFAQENGALLLFGPVEAVAARAVDVRRRQDTAVVVETQSARREAHTTREGTDAQQLWCVAVHGADCRGSSDLKVKPTGAGRVLPPLGTRMPRVRT